MLGRKSDIDFLVSDNIYLSKENFLVVCTFLGALQKMISLNRKCLTSWQNIVRLLYSLLSWKIMGASLGRKPIKRLLNRTLGGGYYLNKIKTYLLFNYDKIEQTRFIARLYKLELAWHRIMYSILVLVKKTF